MKIITRILLGLIIAATLLPLAAGAAPYTTYTYSKEQGPDGNATILTSPDSSFLSPLTLILCPASRVSYCS